MVTKQKTRKPGFRLGSRSVKAFLAAVLLSSAFAVCTIAQNKFEGRPIQRVDITFAGADKDVSAAEQFRLIAGEEIGDRYSTVRIRNALEKLYRTDKIISAKVEATAAQNSSVALRFIIKRKSIAKKISINVGKVIGEPVTEQELLLRLNLLSPGTAISDKVLGDNASVILTYLRERGFFESRVEFEKRPLGNEIDVEVVFNVTPNEQARVGRFQFRIDRFKDTEVKPKLALQPGSLYTLEKLNDDVEKIREALGEQEYLAPRLNEPRVVYDGDKNEVDIEISGEVGAVVKVDVNTEKEKIGNKQKKKLLPILREGTLDYAAIVEGERRLETYYQEKGYFFSQVTPICSVDPQFQEGEASETENETEVLCSALSGADLTNRKIDVKYDVDLNRQLKLEELRIEGTDKLTIPEIQPVLESQEANVFGFIPFFGYGRGYTSLELLRQDRDTIKSLLRELGYRSARVGIKQGVSTDGESLIITFVVREGNPTKIKNVLIEGNTSFTDSTLQTELPDLVGKNFSRARARNGVKKLSQYYADKGYYDAKVSYSTIEVPNEDGASSSELSIVYKVENEGKKVFVNRILINGNEDTKRSAILEAIDLRSDSVLRITDIFASEQSLYSTDAFDRVEIKEEPAGETPDGKNRQTDIIINLDEKPPRLITYGGGFSTDVGLSGFFDIRHFNLFGRLQQGGAQVRVSQRQQLVQVDFLNPRFLSDGKDENGKKRFAPLTFTAQYQRDSTVTRFFRSTFDQGTFGIVQRIDENGNPIDEFGANTGDPTINRFTISAETNRTISKKDRSILFLRYRFEDVRLFNFESLLIKDLLRPDARIRISGFGATFVRDTRENCSVRNTLLEMIAKGEPGDPCRYNPGDPTKGEYLTAEFNVSLPALGANVGFNKLQLTYNKFFTVNKLGSTVFAGRAVLGIANVFSSGDRFAGTPYPGLEGILPISERFFAGGSTTIRGFEFEAAGPRVVVIPQGTFRNQNGEIVNLNPFTIPFGGNALAIANLEARIPFTESVRIVPFYDGGNVFQKAGEIFNPADAPPGDVFRNNARATWTHTIGVGLRIKTPIGGEFAVDYGYLLNPPRFLIPQQGAPDAIFRLHQGQVHFRFSQAF
ncbi:MAG: BamA/TamA family outer membrane protein [Pyrinomonadaceae bacterium]|nr:BamA/TamA family outer membrane protein [Pyrinomonadaceae bacterium]